jgi:hypothetical protein
MLGFWPVASRPIAAQAVAGNASLTATLAVTLDGIAFAATATNGNAITATLAVILDGISFDGAIVSGHIATIAFALDGINVAMTATNSGAPPTPGFAQTLIEIRSFTERRF